MRVLGIESSQTKPASPSTTPKPACWPTPLHTQMAMHAEYGGVVPELAAATTSAG